MFRLQECGIPRSFWVELIWGGGLLYLLYRLVALAAGSSDFPLGGCLILEVVGLPALMLLLDAALLSWVLVELRNAGLGDTGNDALDPNDVVRLMPSVMLTCSGDLTRTLRGHRGTPGRYGHAQSGAELPGGSVRALGN